LDQQFVTGLFVDPEKASEAVRRLLDESFTAEEIGVLVKDDKGLSEEPVRHVTGVKKGVSTGAALGAVLGALGATLVSVGTLPAVGLGLAASGPLAAAASGALGGTAGGGLVGAIGGLGFWKATPDLSEDLKRGAVLVSVPVTKARADAARSALEAAGAKWVDG
jgi:hypothetical protein